ncbi:peptide chain release factor 1 [Chlamydia trachomatis]|nr:peptide chain release factor 1 [Chlamydia trachomatis]
MTDHRIGLTLNKLDRIMNGELEDIISALVLYYQTKQLEKMADDNA